MKRPRHHDIPVPIRNLSVVKAKYGPHADYGAVKPHVDLFDPRIENERHDITEDGKREFALQLQQVRVIKRHSGFHLPLILLAQCECNNHAVAVNHLENNDKKLSCLWAISKWKNVIV